MNTTGTPYNFNHIRQVDEQIDLLTTPGYNTYYILNHTKGDEQPDAILYDGGSGITLDVRTSMPGVLLYTGDYLAAPFVSRQGICLETQLYPDSPNVPGFPDTVIVPGEEFNHYTVFSFK
jgi:aldose 1-epimerase